MFRRLVPLFLFENSTRAKNQSGCLPDFIRSWHCFTMSKHYPHLTGFECQTVWIPSAKQLPFKAMSVSLKNMFCVETAVFLVDQSVLLSRRSITLITADCSLCITWSERCPIPLKKEQQLGCSLLPKPPKNLAAGPIDNWNFIGRKTKPGYFYVNTHESD